MPVDVKKVLAEVEAGLPNSQHTRDSARKNLDFAEMRFDAHKPRTKDGRFDSEMPLRFSPIMKRVVEILAGFLYKTQPTRKLRDPISSEFLQAIYKKSRAWAKWKRADELTCIGGFSALQFAGDPDPDAPVKITQWAPHELVPFIDPDRPTEIGAIATIDAYDNGQRLRLWTEDSIISFEKTKGNLGAAMGSAAWKKTGKEANPYKTLEGAPLIPFTFSHWFYPTCEFTTGGPGRELRRLNEGINKILTDLGDSLPYIAFPIGIATGVDAGWKPPSKVKPGDWLALPAADIDAAGNGILPSLSYLAPELAYIAGIWEDLNFNLDHQLEMHGVPPSLIRMVQSGARSGLAIQAEQLPVINWVEGRRGQWSDYEDDSARMAMLVAWNHYTINGLAAEANRLKATLENWDFSMRWPSMFTQLPGPERNLDDDWRMDRGFVSKVGILMERQDLTEQEALEVMAKVQEQNGKLTAIGVDPNATPLPPPVLPPLPSLFTGEGNSPAAKNGKGLILPGQK